MLLALALGLGLGVVLGQIPNADWVAPVLRAAETVGTLWVNAIRMTVVPLVVSLLVTGVSSAADVRLVRGQGLRALLTFGGLLLLSAVVAFVLLPLLFQWLQLDPATTAAMRAASIEGAREVDEAARAVPTFSQFVTSLVPVNPLQSAARGEMLPLVVFSILFGLALLSTPLAARTSVVQFFKATGDAILVLVRWIIALAPLGVFALMLPLASRAGAETAGALTYYVAVMAVACTALTALLYVVAAVVGGVSFRRFAKGVLPAQAVAVSTSSSLASLPALIDGAETRLQLLPAVARVTLPLAVSMFKVTAPVVWSVAALFLARLYGVELSTTARLSIAMTAGLSSFSVPGIPHGWLLVVSGLLAHHGIPVEGVALLFAVDVVPDIFATTTNVTADMVAATIVARGDPSPAP